MSLVGSTVGSIRIDSRLGEGGMGEVYLGFDTKLERRVAVKTLRPWQRLGERRKERFLREARLLSRLGHPGICQVYELLETPEADFLVLEYVAGRTLGEFADENPSFDETLRMAEQISRALAAAHRERIVHRDLKADNIMVTPEGAIKILDFGIARSLGDEADAALEDAVEPRASGLGTVPLAGPVGMPPTEVWASLPRADKPPGEEGKRRPDLTRHGLVVGTLPAMSPEQVSGRTVDEASDVYSLGVLLQGLFTRKPAYGECDEQELARRIERAETDAMEGIDPELVHLIHDMETLDPRRRPTAEAVAAQLRWIRDRPQRERRRKFRVRVIVGTFVVLLAVLAVVSRLAYVASSARADAESRRRQAEGLIGFMLGDLRTKLTGLGRLELLDVVGEHALEYFESLPERDLSPADLGRRVQTVLQIGDARRSHGDLAGALAAFERGERLAKAATARYPSDAELQLRLAEAATWQGQLHYDRGEKGPAAAAWERALRLAEGVAAQHPDNLEALLARGSARHDKGTLLELQGDLDGAASLYDESLTDQREYARRKPGESEIQGELANTLAFVSILAERRGDLDVARTERRESLSIQEALLAKDLENAVLRQDVAVARGFLANLLGSFGFAEEARELYVSGLATIADLARKDAENAVLARWQVAFRGALADLEAAGGRSAESLVLLREACPASAKLSVSDPSDPDLRLLAGVCRVRNARDMLDSGEPLGKARTELEAGRVLLKQLALEGLSEQNRALVSESEILRGRIALAAADPAEARRAFLHAIEILASCRRPLTFWRVMAPWSDAMLRLGRDDEAAPVVAALETMGYRRPRTGRSQR
ncbi:MAG: serine/threonine-protein kinase [Acidobacteriota bacterium]